MEEGARVAKVNGGRNLGPDWRATNWEIRHEIPVRRVAPFTTYSTIPGKRRHNVTPLMSKILTDIPGKEGLMITVEYPPSGR
jgi:hypothetical protein